MADRINIADAFRTKTRQVPVMIFLVITTITSILATVLFILHLYGRIPTVFMGIYTGVLVGVTLFTIVIPIRASGVSSFSDVRAVLGDLEDKYKIILITYAWISIGGLVFYPIVHVYTTVNGAPSPWSGVIGGVIAVSLSIQTVVINYLFNGSTRLTKEDIEIIKDNLDPDDFDFDDYSDNELSSIPDPVLQKAKQNTESETEQDSTR